jgi:hypothetical protein
VFRRIVNCPHFSHHTKRPETDRRRKPAPEVSGATAKARVLLEKRALENRKEKGSDPSHWLRELLRVHAGAVAPQAIGRPSVH